MYGKDTVHFSELFASAMDVHGYEWSFDYYTKRGMQVWEFEFWFAAYCENAAAEVIEMV